MATVVRKGPCLHAKSCAIGKVTDLYIDLEGEDRSIHGSHPYSGGVSIGEVVDTETGMPIQDAIHNRIMSGLPLKCVKCDQDCQVILDVHRTAEYNPELLEEDDQYDGSDKGDGEVDIYELMGY